MEYFKTPKGTELPFLMLQGKKYLQVAYRILWMREEKPNWVITSRIVERTDSFVIMEATILNEEGKIISSAHKCGKFGPNEIEKSESGAIGRALAFLGYGTQFAEDLLDEGDDIADAPIAPKQPGVPEKAASPRFHLSDAQVKRLYAIAYKNNYSNADIFDILRRYKVFEASMLSKTQYEEICQHFEDSPQPEGDVISL